jgi:putative phosphoesterase
LSAFLDKDFAKIGVISDTHGLLRPEVAKVFAGVDYILHAGDIGSRTILDELEKIAPVLAVAGNTDSPMLFRDLFDTEVFEMKQVSLYLIHNVDLLDLDLSTAGLNAVVYGHSHIASIDYKSNVLYFNPGSAGQSRFNLPVTAGLLEINESKIRASIVRLEE